jgi:hypothetical protein
MAVKIFEQLVVVGAALELADRSLEQASRDNLGTAQGYDALDNQRH